MKLNLLVIAVILSSVGICTSEKECPEQVWYLDADGDGFGNANESLVSCEGMDGYVLLSGDCDDQNAAINPDAEEIVGNGVDENCNPADDECTELGEFGETVILLSQKDVNEFGAKCIGKIVGDLRIGKSFHSTEDPIIDLTPLSSISSVDGGLELIENNELTSLEGLNSNISINANLSIYNNSKLTDFKGLRNLEYISHGIAIQGNHSLVSLEGLEKIKLSNENLVISDNTNLVSLKGLGGLEYISFLFIYNNPVLENLYEIKNIQTLKGMSIFQNEKLSGYFKEGSLPGGIVNVSLENNSGIINLKGLMAHNSEVSGSIYIKGNKNLQSLDGLYPSDTLSFSIEVEDNEKLVDIKALESIVVVKRNLWIINNDQLQSLEGLENVLSAGFDYNIPGATKRTLDISENDLLKDFCALKGLLTDGYAPFVNIHQNAFNPSKDDIISGNCKQ